MHGWASSNFLYTCDPRPSESCGTHGGPGALPSREVGSGAAAHVAALEHSAGRWGPEVLYTRRRQSPVEQGGWVWSCRTHGSPGALLGWEAGSGAAGHMVVPEPSSTGKWGPEV
jgi:hypothetical protein